MLRYFSDVSVERLSVKFILKVKYFLASCDRQPGTPSLTDNSHLACV